MKTCDCERCYWRGRAETAWAAVAAARALHHRDPSGHGDDCMHCEVTWPCPTLIALGDPGWTGHRQWVTTHPAIEVAIPDESHHVINLKSAGEVQIDRWED